MGERGPGRPRLNDPVDKDKEQREEKKAEKELQELDINALSLEDFKQIPESSARTPGPFEGYPLKPPVKIDDAEVSATFIVGLSPTYYVHQDPSGKGVNIKDTKTGKERQVDLQTVHSQIVKDYENGGIPVDVVFDRVLKLKDGDIRCAIVPSHSARSQLLFKLDFGPNKEARIMVDRKYMLLDFEQRNRLRRWFQIIVNPRIKTEQVARIISGESEQDLDEVS